MKLLKKQNRLIKNQIAHPELYNEFIIRLEKDGVNLNQPRQ